MLLAAAAAALHLEQSIRFVKERLPNQPAAIHGLNFHLDASDLAAIRQAQAQGQSLYLRPRFVGDLRAYILFPRWGGIASGLMFSTYYYASDTASGEILVRSSVSLAGDVLHRICDRCLADPELAIDITRAHYWLIDQLLSRLKLEAAAAIDRLQRGLNIAVFLACAASQLEQWLQLDWLSLLGSAALTWGLPKLARPLLARLWPRLQRWLLRQILNGLLAKRQRWRRWLFGWLGRLDYR